MKLLVAPEFSAKLSALTPVELDSLGAFLNEITKATEISQIVSSAKFETNLLDDGIYVSKIAHARVYFTFGSDDDGQYLLLLDATAEQANKLRGNLFALKDPKNNLSVNPKFNKSIDPNFNSALNPAYNSSINPSFNSSINPKFNSAINPSFNSSLNPLFNSAISPKFNASLNPKFNASINPRINAAFGGPYLYGKDLVQYGYLVRANEKVSLVFDLAGDQIGELVRANDKVQVQFDLNNQWTGYVVKVNDDVSLSFSPGGEWIGIVV